MPMDHQHPRPVGSGVNQGTSACDGSEKLFNQIDSELVVISRNEYYFGPTMTPSHNLIHQFLLRLTPEPRRSPVPSSTISPTR
jgi:hypothetical protein